MPRAGKRAWLIVGAVAATLGLAWLGALSSAPDVAETCTHVLALAEQAGETVAAGDRELCEQHYQQLRDQGGLRRWAKLSGCVRRAKTIPEAGGCR